MNSTEHWYLICYDIRKPQRLQKLQRYLRRCCLKLQDSVYLFCGNYRQGEQLRQAISQRISRSVDDVRVYQLPSQSQFEFYGQLPWTVDIFYPGLPSFSHTPATVA
ncbi:CRISPR-associated endonuclease Cas2 [Shewanella sp.]|uniref:CRISPR-associated endonuclease Cas2 n=1 Tax=Shewanella sp. TaxID=50422 RepID=UPI003F340AA0